MNKPIQEKDVFCFRVTLQHKHDEETFVVRFNVLAKDQWHARSILEKWLSVPEQTGFKYSQWVGIQPDPSHRILIQDPDPIASVAENPSADPTFQSCTKQVFDKLDPLVKQYIEGEIDAADLVVQIYLLKKDFLEIK